MKELLQLDDAIVRLDGEIYRLKRAVVFAIVSLAILFVIVLFS